VTEREELHRQLKVLSTWLRHNIRNEMNVVHGIAGELDRAESAAEEWDDMAEQREREAEGAEGNTKKEVGERVDVAADAARIQAHVEHLVEQADRERELVDILVDPPPQTGIDVASVIEASARAKRAEYPDADITVSLDADSEIDAIPQLGRAIDELIDNAVRHNDTRTPTVRVELDRPDRTSVEIHVRDDGPGIPEVERETVHFEQSIDQLNHGSGLGLLFVHCVVTRSGGAIRFSDADPRGSVVTVTLPVEPDDAGK
jgi:signal transduction histidine kinase